MSWASEPAAAFRLSSAVQADDDHFDSSHERSARCPRRPCPRTSSSTSWSTLTAANSSSMPSNASEYARISLVTFLQAAPGLSERQPDLRCEHVRSVDHAIKCGAVLLSQRCNRRRRLTEDSPSTQNRSVEDGVQCRKSPKGVDRGSQHLSVTKKLGAISVTLPGPSSRRLAQRQASDALRAADETRVARDHC